MVAGLGNPGPRYAGTRHDLGFALASLLADEAGASFRREAEVDVTGARRLTPGGDVAVLAMPRLYMNRSGPPLARLLRRCDVPPERLLVLCDDMNLDLGRIRLRAAGSAGGHNGLRSIIGVVGEGFPRLRLGVGREPPGAGRAEWVLSAFDAGERETVRDMLRRGAATVRTVLEDGIETAAARLGKGLPGEREASDG